MNCGNMSEKQVQMGGDICIYKADSFCYMVEMYTAVN